MTIMLLRNKTGIAHTDVLINRMIRLVVETGSLTASMAILILVLAMTPPVKETLTYEAPALMLTKLYANTFMTNLNNRAFVRRANQSISMSRFITTVDSTHREVVLASTQGLPTTQSDTTAVTSYEFDVSLDNLEKHSGSQLEEMNTVH
ncbi:hypothetical protein WOLCODRAFT_167289 [Wolfiporia cocos MD-104 SS10]|uniref:DUF6534 domain-containing protein n=1 Tax=Wolfiporia cocos (strain MD-104) TaxID=742152 RepID=A0A2H3JB73_WOLCO|nr:hypothetical protein WOLCODRAFT_167289 [Wolfiporia cocos MD-104 SS10]